ncbi:Mrp/NBP35 family ATP-binding protein, partial [Staphylococcus epidermidis]|uniref:Mrp/NBP35 family ATP-binding protein n=1 Tax=Staphylococcus epidermidis TaxID=1282 RepID=UPI0021B33544
MAKHTQHTILALIQNISYFQTKQTPKKHYLFPKPPHKNLSHQLHTQLFPQLPLQQPTSNPNDLSPSIYQSDHRLPQFYT